MNAGISRLGHSLTITALIGLGLDFGISLAKAITGSPGAQVSLSGPDGSFKCTNPSISVEALWFIFIPTALVFIVDLNGHPRQWFYMLVVSTVAMLMSYFTYPIMGDPLSSASASFAMGLVSNLYGRWTGANVVAGTLIGLQILVPGTLAVRAFTAQDVTSGLGLAVSVLVIALALGLGLFLASLIAEPLGMGVDYLLNRKVGSKNRKRRRGRGRKRSVATNPFF
jgi:uncharacterized membrane protein YjjB (DUF3815 family)